ncbi:RNA polymerase sigma factor [Chitinimonas sp.]|uniref:RNA polymerase sigma factor n=1 Tax=Chitinimonas sp. TaxID=1934313 RepID=UPI002F92AC98
MNPTATLADAELHQRLQHGDEAAFAQLYRRYKDAVYRFALMLCGASGVAADATQEAFLLLIHAPASYDPAKGALPAFLMGVARNHVRRGLVHAPLPDLEPDAAGEDEDGDAEHTGSPLAGLLSAETLASLRTAIAALPFAYREVVVLCDLQELPYQDAAAVIGCPLGTVRSRLNRARAALAGHLLSAQSAGLETTS